MANLARKITLNVWDEEITPDLLAIVVSELPKKGVIVFNIPKTGMVRKITEKPMFTMFI